MSDTQKTVLDDATRDTLVTAARAVMPNAYAPYSRYSVGAAVLLSDGAIVTGTNFENASYGLSLCAETVALATINSMGRFGDVVALAVVGGKQDDAGVPRGSDPVTPCGRCRQVINEARRDSTHDIIVWCAGATGNSVVRHSIKALLPHDFGPANLA